jgi:hypothetical protein
LDKVLIAISVFEKSFILVGESSYFKSLFGLGAFGGWVWELEWLIRPDDSEDFN